MGNPTLKAMAWNKEYTVFFKAEDNGKPYKEKMYTVAKHATRNPKAIIWSEAWENLTFAEMNALFQKKTGHKAVQ